MPHSGCGIWNCVTKIYTKCLCLSCASVELVGNRWHILIAKICKSGKIIKSFSCASMCFMIPLSGLLDEKLSRKNKRKCTPAPALCLVPHPRPLRHTAPCCSSSRAAAWQLSPLAHNGKHNTQVEFVVCAINSTWRRFPLPHQPSRMATPFHIPYSALPPSHWGRHHWRLLFVASSVFYCSALWGNTKIVAARARWIELFCIVWTNPSTSGWLRGYENMIGAGAGGDTAV